MWQGCWTKSLLMLILPCVDVNQTNRWNAKVWLLRHYAKPLAMSCGQIFSNSAMRFSTFETAAVGNLFTITDHMISEYYARDTKKLCLFHDEKYNKVHILFLTWRRMRKESYETERDSVLLTCLKYLLILEFRFDVMLCCYCTNAVLLHWPTPVLDAVALIKQSHMWILNIFLERKILTFIMLADSLTWALNFNLLFICVV